MRLSCNNKSRSCAIVWQSSHAPGFHSIVCMHVNAIAQRNVGITAFFIAYICLCTPMMRCAAVWQAAHQKTQKHQCVARTARCPNCQRQMPCLLSRTTPNRHCLQVKPERMHQWKPPLVEYIAIAALCLKACGGRATEQERQMALRLQWLGVCHMSSCRLQYDWRTCAALHTHVHV